MCSMIDSGEKGYKLPEQILFNSLVLYLTLKWSYIAHPRSDCKKFVEESRMLRHSFEILDYSLEIVRTDLIRIQHFFERTI